MKTNLEKQMKWLSSEKFKNVLKKEAKWKNN